MDTRELYMCSVVRDDLIHYTNLCWRCEFYVPVRDVPEGAISYDWLAVQNSSQNGAPQVQLRVVSTRARANPLNVSSAVSVYPCPCESADRFEITAVLKSALAVLNFWYNRWQDSFPLRNDVDPRELPPGPHRQSRPSQASTHWWMKAPHPQYIYEEW